MNFKKCPCGGVMEGTDYVNPKNETFVYTRWICLRCLKRSQTQRPNPNFMPVPSAPPKRCGYHFHVKEEEEVV